MERIAISAVCCTGAKKPVAKGGLKVSKPRAKAGGLGVKKMTTKVDDSLFEQAPAEPVVAAPAAPTLVRSPVCVCLVNTKESILQTDDVSRYRLYISLQVIARVFALSSRTYFVSCCGGAIMLGESLSSCSC